MYKSIIIASILAAVSATPKAQFQYVNPAQVTVTPVSPAPVVVTSRSSRVVVENNNAFASEPLKTPSTLTAPLVAAPILAAQFADKPEPVAKTAPPAVLATGTPVAAAPVVTNTVPIVAARSASIVAAPALTKAPLVAGPLILKSGQLVASAPLATKAALLAGPGAPAIYKSVISPYVIYPYASSAYVKQLNWV